MITADYGNPDAPIVLVQLVDDHDLAGMDAEVSAIQQRVQTDFYLTAIKVQDWNRDLSPWLAPAVFGKEDFGGAAEDMLPEVLACCMDKDKTYILGGYSLAGLFALWAACRTDMFSGVAAASPSLWFPGFTDYMQDHAVHADSVYLSLGDKEEKARNPVMATVGERIREAHALLTRQGIDTTLEWNQGNHFKESDLRTAKAFAWVMNRLQGEG